MSDPLVSFSVNLEFILRLFVAFSWGLIWAACLQWNRWGKFLVEERTWITVVIGVGIDLAIAYPEDWWTVAAIIAASAIGIIARSLYNESVIGNKGKRLMPNKSLWNLDDIATLTMDITGILTTMLQDNGELPARTVTPLARVIAMSQTIKAKVEDARKGVYKEPVNA